jgi:hypothetical protein
MAQWLSWLERRPVTAKVVGSSPIWVVILSNTTDNGILAQLGEHLPYKQRVTGSSPVGPILYGWIPEWPKGTDCKSAANCFGGSNPPPSTGECKNDSQICNKF